MHVVLFCLWKVGPCHEKACLGFPTRSKTNQTVQPEKMVRGVKFQIREVEGLYNVTKAKVLISCIFCFAFAKSRLSHDAAQNVCVLA